jgi:hypothetical protein
MGIPAMAGAILRREISFPAGDEESRRRMQPLIDQLLAWRPDVPTRMLRQDLVMALWFCYLHWLDRRKAILTSSDAWQMRSMPFQPTDYRGLTTGATA